MTCLSQAYASVLYLRKFPKFKIVLRGKAVEQLHIADDLKHTDIITYRPQLAAATKDVCVMANMLICWNAVVNNNWYPLLVRKKLLPFTNLLIYVTHYAWVL